VARLGVVLIITGALLTCKSLVAASGPLVIQGTLRTWCQMVIVARPSGTPWFKAGIPREKHAAGWMSDRVYVSQVGRENLFPARWSGIPGENFLGVALPTTYSEGVHPLVFAITDTGQLYSYQQYRLPVRTSIPLERFGDGKRLIRAASFSVDGTALGIVESSKTVSLWDTGTGALRKSFQVPAEITSLCVPEQGETAVLIGTAAGTVYRYSANAGQLEFSESAGEDSIPIVKLDSSASGPIRTVAVSASGVLYFADEKNSFTGVLAKDLVANFRGEVLSAQFIGNGRFIVAKFSGDHFFLIETKRWEVVAELGLTGMGFHPNTVGEFNSDSTHFYAGVSDGAIVEFLYP